jgi:hypothetical protein
MIAEKRRAKRQKRLLLKCQSKGRNSALPWHISRTAS